MALIYDKDGKINLDHPLLKLSSSIEDYWTLRDATKGTFISGGIGSGKSSGSGKTLAKSFLKHNFGGIVLCAKPEEKDEWLNIVNEVKQQYNVDRSEDIIIFEKQSSYQFNPIEYEVNRAGEGAGEIFNLTNLLMEIYKMGNKFGGGQSGQEERFWANALRRCINRSLQLLKLAKEKVSINNLRKILSTAPSENEIEAFYKMSEEEMLTWSNSSYCVRLILIAGDNENEDAQLEYELIYDYFMKEFAFLAEKTRSTIIEAFMGIIEPFSLGIMRQHFSKGVSPKINPEETYKEGKIIILNFPVKEFLQAGVYAQSIYKLLWQQAVERREVKSEDNPIPVFLWVDESQLFLSDYDQIFQTTARSSLACTVFITQNISNYYAMLGGQKPEVRVDSLLGNLCTKIFHANNDAVTNEWASKTIGRDFQSISGLSLGQDQRMSLNKQLLNQVEPIKFTTLKSGGKQNGFQVDSIITVAGRVWSDGKNYIETTFSQL
jgi:hypothetical protein